MHKPIIEIKNLVKTYNKINVLNDVSLIIYEGDKIALIGANGAGKSTLVDIIAGVRTSTSGEIIYHLKNPKQEIGLQFQDNSFPGGLKFNDILHFYCSMFKRKANDPEVIKLMEYFNVAQFRNRWVSRLSGGQSQRVNAFLTILTNPTVLIMDELSTGLDITTRIEMIDFINGYLKKHKKTFITISHNADEIIQTSNRIVILDNGEIIKDCKTSEMGGEKGVSEYFIKKIKARRQ